MSETISAIVSALMCMAGPGLALVALSNGRADQPLSNSGALCIVFGTALFVVGYLDMLLRGHRKNLLSGFRDRNR